MKPDSYRLETVRCQDIAFTSQIRNLPDAASSKLTGDINKLLDDPKFNKNLFITDLNSDTKPTE